jgi:hypothetical protein
MRRSWNPGPLSNGAGLEPPWIDPYYGYREFTEDRLREFVEQKRQAIACREFQEKSLRVAVRFLPLSGLSISRSAPRKSRAEGCGGRAYDCSILKTLCTWNAPAPHAVHHNFELESLRLPPDNSDACSLRPITVCVNRG